MHAFSVSTIATKPGTGFKTKPANSLSSRHLQRNTYKQNAGFQNAEVELFQALCNHGWRKYWCPGDADL